jgi:stage IV sporulation protein FB
MLQFTFLQIPVYIQPAFWLFAIFFTGFYRDPSMQSLIVGVVLFISLMVHEYGHALTAKYFGANPTVTLEAFGGKAEYNGFRIKKWQDFVITMNGPLFESMLILISYTLLKQGFFLDSYYIRYFLYVTMKINILWCTLNLLPIAPLDGGRMAASILETLFKFQGYKISLLLGMATAVIGAPLLYLKGYFFFAVLLLIFGFQHIQKWQEASV